MLSNFSFLDKNKKIKNIYFSTFLYFKNIDIKGLENKKLKFYIYNLNQLTWSNLNLIHNLDKFWQSFSILQMRLNYVFST